MLILSCSATQWATAGSSTAVTPDSDLLSCAIPSNCVNTMSSSGLPALSYTGTPAQALAALQQTLATFAEATEIRVNGLVIESVFTTRLGFRDMVTFKVDPQKGRIDFRSRSSLGLYDFGKNRSRMNDFSERYRMQTVPPAGK